MLSSWTRGCLFVQKRMVGEQRDKQVLGPGRVLLTMCLCFGISLNLRRRAERFSIAALWISGRHSIEYAETT